MTSPSVQLRGVWKRYGRRSGWVLRDVDLTIDPGRIMVVLGGNGDGKSTLLRIVAGASAATRGEVRRRPASVALVPERLPADQRMTAARYLRHMAALRGRDAARTLERSTDLLDLFRLAPGADVPIARLSKGNRQKVLLAQAFGFPADLIVLDEPFSGLDEPAAEELRGLLDRTRADGRAALVSAHRPELLEGCDEIRRLVDGRLRHIPTGVHRSRPPSGRRTELVLHKDVRAKVRALTEVPGVCGVRPVDGTGDEVGERARVVVVTTDPDELLRVALGSGWSFVRGGPEAGTEDSR